MKSMLPTDKRRAKHNNVTVLRVMIMVFCYVLNTEFGFGHERLSKLLRLVYKHVEDENKEDGWIDTLEYWSNDIMKLNIK